MPVAEALEGLKELINQFSDDYEVYVSKEIQIKVEMNSMSTNDVWDLEVIPNGVKIVGC